MALMTGAEALYEFLVRQGVRYIFGNPGTTELPLMDMFAARDEISYILALHEDTAVGIAAGYAEATRTPAVVNLHTWPGLAHGLGNLYNAARAGTPLIVTAGQQDTRAMISEPLLYGDMLQLVRNHTKWSWEALHAADVPVAFARAFKVAMTPPTGPVFISLPVDAMEERADIEVPQLTEVARTRLTPDPKSIEASADILMSAINPVIIAGDQSARCQALPEIVLLAETLGARVHSEPLNGLLDFPTGHPLYGGPLFANAAQTRAQLQDADVLLILGANLLTPLVHTGDRMIPPVKIVQIDVDEHELGKNWHAEVAVWADIKTAVSDLNYTLAQRLASGGGSAIRKRREAIETRIAELRAGFAENASAVNADGPLSPGFVARELRVVAAPDAIIADESVTSTAFVRTLFEMKEPDSFFYAKGGSLGLGLPLGVGVKLAHPDRQVICTVGDGAAMYSPQALWTAAKYRLGVVFVVFNNTSYMILKGGLMAMKGESARKQVFTGMDMTDPEIDFVNLSQSMGVPAQKVIRPRELRPALEWALEAGGPALLDVRIGREVRSVLR